VPNVIIRDAIPQDVDALLELNRQLGSRNTDVPPQAATVAAIEHLDEQPWLHLLVAEREGEVVGTVTVAVVPSLAHTAKPWAQIENMVVHEEHRRSGIGEALIKRCEEICQAAGVYKLQLTSSAVREGAHSFYAQVGFEPGSVGFRKYFE
jgi:predicted N-acetyltransferase YhbS